MRLELAFVVDNGSVPRYAADYAIPGRVLTRDARSFIIVEKASQEASRICLTRQKQCCKTFSGPLYFYKTVHDIHEDPRFWKHCSSVA